MRQTRLDIVRTRQNAHSKFLRQIVSEGLLRKSGYFPQFGENHIRMWQELCFGEVRICAHGREAEAGNLITQPDIVCYNSGPEPYLIIVEAKFRLNRESWGLMQDQLSRDHEYIERNPGKLADFLTGNGIDDDKIDRLTIGFSGVTRTRHGLKQVMYFELFQNAQ